MAAKKKVRATTAPPVSATRDATREGSGTREREPDVDARASGVLFASEEEITDRTPPVSVVPPTSLPPAWMERLLSLSLELPVEEGDEAVVRAAVDAVAELLPRCAVGACFVAAHAPAGGAGRQQVVRRHPSGDEHRGKGIDPTRLFPEYAHELIVDVPGEPSGSTLHAACDEPAALASHAPATHLLDRAARVVRRGLEQAQVYRGAKSARGELHALNAQMVQAEKLASLGQIAAGMVHELNNPLTSIVAYTDYLTKRWLAKREHADGDELERLRRIGESAHRLLRFTRDLVTYARPSGDVPIPVVIHGVIDQALVFCEHVLAEANARVERKFGDGILPVRGLPEQLTQVFVNLVTNACHAMPSGGGTITISTELVEHDRRVRIVVADTGTGIPPQNIGRVFVPFFTTKSDGRGTGLGLAIVKSIVEGHDGTIRVESDPPRGTQFIVVLPVHQHEARVR